MRKTSKIIIVTIIATSILLGLGYAAIQNITLNITGTAAAQASQDNFKVRFTKVLNVSDAVNVTANVNNDTTASINVTGLTERGQTVAATYEIENQSGDLSSDLKINTTNSNTEYFVITSFIDKSSLTAGEKTTVTVMIELLKTPISEAVGANIGVTLEAMPVEPGKEGTSEGTNDFSQTPNFLNEYGFMFNEAYVFNIEIDDKNIEAITIFQEDGTIEMYTDGVIEIYTDPGTAIYSKSTIDVSGYFGGESIIEIAEDGKSMIFDGQTGYLDTTYMQKIRAMENQKNEYGFYFNKPYSVYQGEESLNLLMPYSLIFKEDGSIECYIDRVIYRLEDAGEAVYEELCVKDSDGNVVVEFSPDGRLADINGYIGNLDMHFIDRVNSIENPKNEYGFYFNEPYSVIMDDGILTIIFKEDGSGEVYENGVHALTEEAGTFWYGLNEIDSLDLSLEVLDNGRLLLSSFYGFSLDVDFYDRDLNIEES